MTGKALIPFSSVPATQDAPAAGPDWKSLKKEEVQQPFAHSWAQAHVEITEGRVVGVTLTNGGSGYTSPPIVEVYPPPGQAQVHGQWADYSGEFHLSDDGRRVFVDSQWRLAPESSLDRDDGLALQPQQQQPRSIWRSLWRR